ncbi:MAG: GH36-type glycosyl hydrolase domain-containing protein, partial [Chthoniobacterales bacterium]
MFETNDYQKYGDFSGDGREFVIRRFDTPRPWINYAWNDKLLVAIDQRGRGTSLHRDQAGHRTIPIRDRFVYVKDHQSGRFWTIGWDPVRLPFDHYVCKHGLGYSTLECTIDEIWCQWTLTASASEPAEIWSIRIENHSSTERTLSIYPAVEFDLGGWTPYGTVENYSTCRYNGHHSLIALNQSDERPDAKNHAIFSAEKSPNHYETRKRDFLGRYYSTLASPAGVIARQLSNQDAATEDFIAAFQYDIRLKSGADWQHHFAAGCVGSETEEPLIQRCASAAAFTQGIEAARQRTKRFSGIDITLPDERWTHLFNTWTKQQLFLLKEFARVYLIGFRDTLQDAKALCAYAPDLAADSILKALRHQFQDGSTMRGWCPDDLHKYADSGVWLPMAVAEYLRETNDLEFLSRCEIYRDGGEGSIWDHVLRAIAWFFENLGS